MQSILAKARPSKSTCTSYRKKLLANASDPLVYPDYTISIFIFVLSLLFDVVFVTCITVLLCLLRFLRLHLAEIGSFYV
jgi:hypothetical protein